MTLPNISIPANTWVNLYAETGSATGSKLIVQNLCTHKLKISHSDTQPTDLSSYFHARSGDFITNDSGDGFWVYSHIDAIVAVAEG